MKKITLGITTFIVLGILLRFFTGIYDHDEFAETHFFIKHRPIWKWKFYSPIGQSDLKLEDLNLGDQKEQLLFDEFIRKRGLSK